MSQYGEHPENIPQHDGGSVNKKPVRKPRKESSGATFGKSVLYYLHDLVYLLAIFLVVLLIVFRVVVVSGPSMKNTLVDGDNLLVLSSTFYGTPDQGDIVIISKQSFENGEPIIKRVIAAENQWINIDFSKGIVYVGDSIESMQPIQEDYIRALTTQPEGMKFPVQIPEGCLFVMGDNRSNSTDSRNPMIGFVDEREVIGKAFFLVLPGTDDGNQEREFSRFGVVH